MGALEFDTYCMTEALSLAEKGFGRVAPNPPVGCVIAKDGKIIGRGWHKGPGTPHAEPNALADARNTYGAESLNGATVYVTLEPCNHTGRTGPCSVVLYEAGIARVLYAIADPNDQAAGGAEFLRKHGVEATGGLCREAALYQQRAWRHWLKTNTPLVIAKFAASLDGRIATSTGDSKWITGDEARARAHELRAQSDAIIVGAQTIIDDDPALTVRDGDGNILRAPQRIVLDSRGRTPIGAKVFERSERPTILASLGPLPSTRAKQFDELGTDLLPLSADEHGRPDLSALLAELGARGLNSVMIEGGAKLLGSFFDANLVDEVWAFIAPKIIGGGTPAINGNGPSLVAQAHSLIDPQLEQHGRDILIRGAIKKDG